MDKSKCVSYPITDHKALGENIYSLSSAQCDTILIDYSDTLNLANSSTSPHRSNRILQVDAQGKVLHEIYGFHQHYNNPDWKNTDDDPSYDITLWVITDKEGNYNKDHGIMVMYSDESNEAFIYDANTVLEFKNNNGWIN